MPEASPSASHPGEGRDAPPSLTPDQATAKLEAMIGKPPDEEKDKPADPSAEPEEPAPAQAGVEELPAEELSVLEGDEDNAEVEGEEALFTVKIDGRDVPVPVSEARDGYLRRADYTQKTQELAQQRNAFAEHANQVLQERQVYGVLISALEEQVKSQMPQEPDWPQLLAHPDKSYYWTARANWDETQRRLQAIGDEKERLSELQTLETHQKLNEHLSQARTWLTEQLPEWRDEKRAQTDKAKLRDYAIKNGFTQHDVDHAYDPRLVLLAHKARLYDQLVANRPRPSNGAGAPESLKPGVATHEPATVQAKLTKAKRRLAQTGRPEDATAAIELILQRGR